MDLEDKGQSRRIKPDGSWGTCRLVICVKQRTTCMFCSGDGRHLEGESLGGQDVEEEIQGDFFCGICPGGTLAHSMLNIIFIGPESDHWQCLSLTH